MNPRAYIISPSSAVPDRAVIRRGVARLKGMGIDVELDPSAFARHTRFAGDDATRLDAIRRAADSGAEIVMTTRGGYGLTRVLPDLPYKAIAKSIRAGTRWVGFSDFTALQLAVMAKTGEVTWQGPAVGEDFGTEAPPDDIMQACFADLVEGRGEGAGWQLPARDALARPVHAKGTLWGGNLCVLSSMAGTPWMPAVKGGILFLEDVGEHPYRIERMLTQLLHAGILARQKAILLGQFNHFKLGANDKGFKLQTVVDWLRTKVRAPVVTGLPFGHVPTKVCLPVGTEVEFAAEGRDAIVVWGHRH